MNKTKNIIIVFFYFNEQYFKKIFVKEISKGYMKIIIFNGYRGYKKIIKAINKKIHYIFKKFKNCKKYG